MNLVFITRSGERAHNWRRQQFDLAPIAAHILAAAGGGAVIAYGLATLGTALRRLDPSPHHVVYLTVFASVSLPLIVLQGRGKMGLLPERREQVPRRWLGWKRRWWTAAAYGAVLGAGFFTHVRYASMYMLALAALVAPSPKTAAILGMIYGTSRGATVLYAWWTRRLTLSLPRPAIRSILLAATATAVPAWILSVVL